MLVHLFVENLMLIQKAQVDFASPFVAITGESGSGKSSLIEALKLALGAKSNNDLIRRGESSAQVRATFDLSALEPFTKGRLQLLFEEASLPWDEQEPLIIQRQLFSTKASKAFCCGLPVPTTWLARLGMELVELIDPGASMTLEGLEAHLDCLDAFIGLEQLRSSVQEYYDEHQTQARELKRLHLLLQTSEQQRDLLEYQIEEIESAALQIGEEQTLDEQLRLLSQSKQFIQTLGELKQELASASFTKLAKHLSFFERHGQSWPQSTDLMLCLQGCLVQADEAHQLAERLREKLQEAPQDLETISKRLDLIHSLKKKYGSSLEKIQAHLSSAKEKLQEILQAQERYDELQISCEKSLQKLKVSCQELTQKRVQGAQALSARLIEVLKELNMPHAEFSVHLEPKEIGPSGADSVEFFLSPNSGEPSLSVRRYASGGEMARLFLALKTLKAHKRIPPTLVFDEIDASIGGHSAAKLADKLLDLSRSRQVLCITHFSQVAEKAKSHLVLEKAVQEGRTLTQVRAVSSTKERKEELLRMLGKSPTSKERTS